MALNIHRYAIPYRCSVSIIRKVKASDSAINIQFSVHVRRFIRCGPNVRILFYRKMVKLLQKINHIYLDVILKYVQNLYLCRLLH